MEIWLLSYSAESSEVYLKGLGNGKGNILERLSLEATF